MHNVQLFVSMHFCAQVLGELIGSMFWPILVTPLFSLTNSVPYLFKIHSAAAVVVVAAWVVVALVLTVVVADAGADPALTTMVPNIKSLCGTQ